MRPRHVLMALTIAAAMLTVACTNNTSDNGVATGVTPGQTATPTVTATPDAQRFAACLRERGIEVDDPPPGGQVEIDQKDDDTRAALRACARYAPPSRLEDRALNPAAARAYAGCVRGKGFPDFPDPDANGLRIPKELAGDERFEAADRECAPLLNNGKGGKS